MLQEMKLVLRAHRTPGMDENDVPSPSQVLRMASEHGAKTTAFRGEIGRLDPGMQFDAVAIDYEAAIYPYQDDQITMLDALVQRAHQRHVDTVYVGGDPIYAKGRFKYVDRDAVLAEIAEQLSRPRTAEEETPRPARQGRVPACEGVLRRLPGRRAGARALLRAVLEKLRPASAGLPKWIPRAPGCR